jgi:hypothetical protein
MYTCIPVEVGVDIALSRAFFFTFNSLTHYAMDLGNNRVRIGRKISDLIEIVETPVESFVDINGIPVASTYTELNNYFNTKSGSVKAGEGISVTNNTVSVLAGGPSTLGGYKVGTGLIVDGSGKLSASAVSEVTKVLATEAEMLALSTETLRPYRIIRLDTKRLYFLNAGDSPAVLSNWFTGPSIETTVLSFKGRTGVLTSEFGDYNFDLIPLVDKTSQDSYRLVIDQNKLYVEDIATSTRTEVSYASSMSELGVRLTSLEDIVSSPYTGLVRKVGDNQDAIASLNNAINNTTTGIANRLASVETTSTTHSSQITTIQAKDTSQDNLISDVRIKANSLAESNVALDQRVINLESRPAGTDYSQQIAAIENKNTTQDTRLTAIDASLISKAPLVDGKVPYENLPEFPVGRKVNVANRAARLALSVYSDLTIAYQSDSGDAWGLDANADPAIDSNWSKLGNAQAIGVASFNGRTGQIGPMSGDYNAGQITELVDKRFVSQEQITRWDASAGGGVSSFNGRTGAIVPLSADYTADMITESSTKKFVTTAQATSWDAKETTTGSQAKASAAQTAAVASAKTYADSTFIPLSQKNSANGVAPLGADSKVPAANLPIPVDISGLIPLSQKGAVSGVAPLGTNSRVASANLPTYLPQAKRIWREVKSQRVVGTYYKNVSGNEQVVRVRHKSLTASGRFTQIVVRASQATQWFEFNTMRNGSIGTQEEVMAVVPTDWEYAVTTSGGTTDVSMIDTWYEMY